MERDRAELVFLVRKGRIASATGRVGVDVGVMYPSKSENAALGSDTIGVAWPAPRYENGETIELGM